MALWQELSGQGRVVGGYLAGGAVLSGSNAAFSKNGDLLIQHPAHLFKRPKMNAETVSEWEELKTDDGIAGAIGHAAARAALPGMAGKAVGAGLGAALNAAHTVRVSWTDGKQSIIEFPKKQFMVFSILLKDRQSAEVSAGDEPQAPSAQSDVAGRIVGLAGTMFPRSKQRGDTSSAARDRDVTEQIAKLASLHAQGILTDVEFSNKKAELLDRI